MGRKQQLSCIRVDFCCGLTRYEHQHDMGSTAMEDL
jgi:hypothetical protein